MGLAFAALAIAFIIAVVSLVPERKHHLLLGKPGDHISVDGFSLGSEHLGEPGRWSRGEGIVRFAAYPAPASVALRLTPPDGRAPDTIEIVVNGTRIHRVTLGAGWNDLEVPVGAPYLPDGITLRIRSAVTRPPEGPPRGVFVEHVTLTTGGRAPLPQTPAITLTLLSAVFLAAIAFAAWNASPASRRSRRWLFLSAVLVLAVTALVMFRIWLMPRLMMVTGLCWGITLATLVIRTEQIERLFAEPRRKGLATLTFAVAAIALVCALFPEALTKGYVLSQADMFYEFFPWRAHLPDGYRPLDRPPFGDVPMLFYPYSVFIRARAFEGMFPLWTNAIASGQPFLGAYHSGLFSPFTWMLTLVPLPQATVVIAVVRLLVGGIGMFSFLRAIGLSSWAAAFGGLTYLLNPFSLVMLEFSVGAVPPWLPWMLLAGERVASGSRWALPALGIVTALVLTGGHPHTGLFVALFGGGYVLVRALGSHARVHVTLLASVAMALGAALAAVQILPFLEYLSLSRALSLRTSYELNPFFAPSSTLITAIVPNFLGHPGSGNYAGASNYIEQQIYPGMATWLLAATGLAYNVGRWRAWFFALAGSMSMLAMYAAPGVHELISSLPLIKGASLQRGAIVCVASLTILAAYGVDHILTVKSNQRGRWFAVTMLGVGAIVIALIANLTLRDKAPFLVTQGLLEYTSRWTSLAIWLACASVLVAMAGVHRLLPNAVVGFALSCLIALDLLVFGRGFHPLIPPAQVFPVVPEIELVRQDPGLFRVMGLGNALVPNAAMSYGLQDVRGYDSLGVARYADLLDVALRSHQFWHIAEGIHSPLIDLLNVKYVFGVPNIQAPEGWFTKLTDGEAPVYRNNRVFPRAFLVDGYMVQDGNPARRTLRDGLVDFHRVALVEQELPEQDRPVSAASLDAVGDAEVARYDDHRVEIRTDANDRRLLVLTDVHYPGWEVSVDGQPASLYRANFAFRAVSVPAGRHTVMFEYRPLSVRVGVGISLGALLMLGALGAYAWRRPASITDSNETLTSEPAAGQPDPSP